VDQDLKDTLKEMKDTNIRALGHVEGKIDGLQAGLQSHMLESATKHVEVLGIAKVSHKRLDEHLDEHKGTASRRWELWLALIVAGLSGLGTLVLTIYQLSKGIKP